MSKRRGTKRNISELTDDESDFNENEEEILIPNPDDSGSDEDNSSDDDISESESSDNDGSKSNFPDNDDSESGICVSNVPYQSVFNNYTEKQKLLEPDHTFEWCEGEKVYSGNLTDELLLPDTVKEKISSMSHVELFELFFCNKIKNYIIQASEEYNLQLSMNELNTFVGILLLSTYNIRNDQKEYWETDPLVHCSAVSSAMTRDRFTEIKSKIKYSKPIDENNNDKAWKVRRILELFRTNIQQFGFFSTALSIDEMMVRFFGRTSLRQYLPSKPDRYGIKLWALCGANGYIFNVDVYCGKNDASVGINLSACPLGSRVVLQMVNPLLIGLSQRKLSRYHIYFDNYFTSPDLVTHLKKFGLRATGTVRKDRVKQKHVFEKKASRGTYKASYDRNSGMNFISVIDSKEVSILSTASGITPLKPMERFSKTAQKRMNLEFPCAITSYNKYMGGVDLHDFRCKKASPSIHSKKWPFTIFLRIIEMSITNAVTLRNILQKKDKKKMKTKDMCKEVSRIYLSQSKLTDFKYHKHESRTRSSCANKECRQRTTRYCTDCKKYYCKNCFSLVHAEK